MTYEGLEMADCRQSPQSTLSGRPTFSEADIAVDGSFQECQLSESSRTMDSRNTVNEGDPHSLTV